MRPEQLNLWEDDEFVYVPEELFNHLPKEYRDAAHARKQQGEDVLRIADKDIQGLIRLINAIPTTSSLSYIYQRFRPEIMTQSLKHACYDPADDYPEIFEGMKRCSHYSGHDRVPDLSPELPPQKDIEADIQALVDFHKKISERKATLEKGHSYEKGPEPEFL